MIQAGDGQPFLDVPDITGTRLRMWQPARRVVSLVPSITETLFALDGGASLLGRTRYCVQPMPEVKRIETVGGTKDPDIGRIVALNPDVVLANREENRREDIESLRAAGLAVHVNEPKSPSDALDMVALYGTMLDHVEEAVAIVVRGEAVLEELAAEREERDAADALRLNPRSAPSAVCLIWREPWMAVGRDTYIGAMIETLGAEHLYHDETERYFEVTPERLTADAPGIVLLPDEPFHFGEEDAAELAAACALAPFARERRIRLCDGQDLMWFGARTPGALARLRPLLRW